MTRDRRQGPSAKGSAREVSVGLRAKTARAIAVVVGDGEDGPEVLLRCEIPTWDPAVPDSRQPHHAGLGLAEGEARRRVGAAEAAVHSAAAASVKELVARLRKTGLRTTGIAVVGPPRKDPSRIGQDHVRAHAAEGQLFRDVLEQAAAASRIPCVCLDERSGYEEAALELHCEVEALKKQVSDLGRRVGPPWRAHEKLACLGALVLLAGR